MATRKATSTLTRRTIPEQEPVGDALAADHPLPEALFDHIRVRAYYLSLERNGAGGDPLADWLQAERELVAGLA